jgi:GNAT superfamily N-acetyltransferase
MRQTRGEFRLLDPEHRATFGPMHRADAEISFEAVDPAEIRPEVVAHHRELSYLGDFFMGHHQLTGDASRVVIDGGPAGAAASHDDHLTYFKLNPGDRRLERQALEAYLAARDISHADVASWDAHHVDLVGGFATMIRPQAYQFELLAESALREPIDGISLRRATHDDLDYLTAQDFVDNYDELLGKGDVRIAERLGAPVGIGLLIAHVLHDQAVDIGMYADPSIRRQGIGSSILALLAREALDTGRRVAAGCWWRNWESRQSIERAGLACVGTIFRLDLDRDRFALDVTSRRTQIH